MGTASLHLGKLGQLFSDKEKVYIADFFIVIQVMVIQVVLSNEEDTRNGWAVKIFSEISSRVEARPYKFVQTAIKRQVLYQKLIFQSRHRDSE